MALSLSKKDARKVQRFLAQPRACLLCGAFPATVASIFEPTHPELWGGTPGKRRLIGYGLCARCFALPGDELTFRVEARLMRNQVGRGN